mmetsp:Transcript_9559/g.20672  ORF Transcript_9559/g.20672 Transcript_9559/m.20672 type:complete len:228 (+) Transcript_9559:690-1373(+)
MNPPRLYFPAMPCTSLALSRLRLVVRIKSRQSRTPARSRLRGAEERVPGVVAAAGVTRALAPQSMLALGVFARNSLSDSILGSPPPSPSSMAVSISIPPAAAPESSVLTPGSEPNSERRPAKSMPLAEARAPVAEDAGRALPSGLRFKLKLASWNLISSDFRTFRSFCNFSVALSKDSVTPRSMPCVSSCFFLRTSASIRESISTVMCVTFCVLFLSWSRTWSSSFL